MISHFRLVSMTKWKKSYSDNLLQDCPVLHITLHHFSPVSHAEKEETDTYSSTQQRVKAAAIDFNKGQASEAQVDTLCSFAVDRFNCNDSFKILPMEGSHLIFEFPDGISHKVDFSSQITCTDNHAVSSWYTHYKLSDGFSTMIVVTSIALLVTLLHRGR